MTEKTKPQNETPENSAEKAENDSLKDDQTERKYYYDDAYGYEVYDGEDDENDVDSD
jgi:hypothetical protein